jgi:hypothetical protein
MAAERHMYHRSFAVPVFVVFNDDVVPTLEDTVSQVTPFPFG